jgi:hypothetical protein
MDTTTSKETKSDKEPAPDKYTSPDSPLSYIIASICTACVASFSAPSSIPDEALAKLGQHSYNKWRISVTNFHETISYLPSPVILP